MNCRILGFVLLAFSSLALAEQPTAQPPPAAEPAKWTVTGKWLAKHPNWSDTIAIRPDGAFTRSGGDGGKWRLSAEDDHLVLQLNWDAWQPEVIGMVSADLFRGPARGGQLELRRIVAEIGATPVAPGEKPEPEPAKEFDDPALKARLANSVWQLEDSKQFTLHADGSTSGDWHSRKGFWRIVGPNQVQLTTLWRPKQPSTVAVEAKGSILRWPDSEWAKLAKRIEPEEQ